MTHQDKLAHRHIVYNFDEVQQLLDDRPYPLALSGHYHAAQENTIQGSATLFAQTAAITRPDSLTTTDSRCAQDLPCTKLTTGSLFIMYLFP